MTGSDRTASRRRDILRGAAGLGGLGLMSLGGCATTRTGPAAAAGPAASGLAFYDRPPALAPIRAHADRFFKITVCLRPFRAQGPRLDAEPLGDKLVVHNYGHGGSGWSLSWGSARIAVGKALAGGERDLAVIGCGALGLTAATVAQHAGADVTIYAKERMPEARSSRATGTWSPDSRVALARSADARFPDLWEEMARTSFRTYQSYLGLPGDPVEWTDRYALSDIPFEAAREKHRREDSLGFAQYSQSRLQDLTPRPQPLPAGAHPFPAPYVQRSSAMMFNVASYGHTLMSDFLAAGGRIETRTFNSPGELSALKQKVIINCTGYGARALWKDESIVPVRGQIAWLIPQPEVDYGLSYHNVTMLSRRDGIVIQQAGETEAWGYGDANERPDRAEAEAALKVFQDLYARMGVRV